MKKRKTFFLLTIPSNQVISAALHNAEKENDSIYHDPVPHESKLALIEKKPIVKPVPIPETVHLTGDRDPFYRLVPFAITEKLSIYQVKIQKIMINNLL